MIYRATMIYQGVYVRGLTSPDLEKLRQFETDVEKKAAIVMWYQSWAAPNEMNFNTALMNAVRQHGSIPLITWEPRNILQGPNQPQFKLQNIIDGFYDRYIRTFAYYAKLWNHPFFLRFAHEMNDQWAPWSEQVNNNRTGQYILAWRHIHDIFKAEGTANATWVWCPDSGADIDTLRELYPGDSYVDWVCMDGYNDGNDQWRSFATTIGPTYENLREITDKPQMIAEIGSAEKGGSKANWITDAYSYQLPNNFPAIRAILWFNVNQEKETVGIDWRIESSTASQHAFASAVHAPIYVTNQFSSLTKSPIPSLG